jgi:hypothetical protein
MGDLNAGQIELKIHGLKHVNNSEVPASVFAAKLRALVSALESADQALNGKLLHVYTIGRLHTSEPTAILNERPRPRLFVPASASAVPTFESGIDAIKSGGKSARKQPHFASAIVRMASGSDRKFGFAEVRTSRSNVIRIDEFLHERAKSVAEEIEGETIPEQGWYKGAVFATFDGKLQFVDTRGALPQIKLILSAGGKEIDCICRREDIDAVGTALDRRVRIAGRAIYDGKSGLPRRVEVTDIKVVPLPGDFSRWRGAFAPLTESGWEGEDV